MARINLTFEIFTLVTLSSSLPEKTATAERQFLDGDMLSLTNDVALVRARRLVWNVLPYDNGGVSMEFIDNEEID